MAARNAYLEFLLEWMEPLGEITSRAMFGGHCLYCNGVVFALVADNALYLKADEHNRPRFEERKLRPFQPYPDRPEIMQYYQPPAEFFEDGDSMREWAEGALAAGVRAAARKKPKRKRI